MALVPTKRIVMDGSTILSGQANSQIISEEDEILTPPGDILVDGQTISFCNNPTAGRWFAIRATQHRAQKVYDSLKSLNDNSLELYLPLLKRIEYSNDDFDNPTQTIVDVPVDPNLLFVRCNLNRMLYYLYDETRPQIPGFTPYYNHCKFRGNGRNELLVVPDRQLESFRIIIESGNKDVLINAQLDPKYLNGDLVEVVGGPFKGVQGTITKFNHQKRVVVQIEGLGTYVTAYISKNWIRKVEAGRREFKE